MRPRRGISESAQHGPWPAPGPELSLLSRQSPSAAPALGHHECQTYRAGSESVRAGLGFGLPGPRTGHGHGSTRRQPPFPAAFGSCWCKNSPQIHTKIFPYASSPRFTGPGRWLMLSGMLWIRGTTMFTMFGHGICVSWEYHQRR